MYCKVRKGDEIYYSPVLIVDSNKGEFVVFNKACSGFEKTGVSGETNNALIINYDCSDFVINTDDFQSVWADKKISEKVLKGDYDEQLVEEAKKFINRDCEKEYYEIKNEDDIEAFEFSSGGIIDGYIVCKNESGDETEYLIATMWGSYVKIKCAGLIKDNAEPGNTISSGELEIKDDGVWLKLDSEDSIDDVELCSKKMWYNPLFEEKHVLFNLNFDLSDDGIKIYDDDKQSVYADVNYKNVYFVQQDDGKKGLLFEYADKIIAIDFELYEKEKFENLKEKLDEKRVIDADISFDHESLYENGKTLYSDVGAKPAFEGGQIAAVLGVCLCAVGYLLWKLFAFVPEEAGGIFVILGAFIAFCLIMATMVKSNKAKTTVDVCENCIDIRGGIKETVYYSTVNAIELDKEITIIRYGKKLKLPKMTNQEELYEKMLAQWKAQKEN